MERPIIIPPGSELCECGRLHPADERLRCEQCGHRGCAQCMRTVKDTDDPGTWGWTWVCSTECAIEWLEGLQKANERVQKANERGYHNYQKWIGKRIAEERARQVAENIAVSGSVDI